MDGARFDDLVRTFADTTSRRSVLKGLLASAAAALGARAGSARAQACRPAGRLCSVSSQCCSGLCDTTNPDPTQRNRCACPPGQENCRGLCTDPATAYRADPANCGACDRRCPVFPNTVATCADKVCGYACRPGFADCNGAMEDGCETVPATDPAHCGGCGATCSGNNMATVVCDGGSCEAGECAAGFADCNNDKRTDGCEIDLNNDPRNCGGCGTVCSANHIATPTCAGGLCTGVCDTGWADCNNDKRTDGCETDVTTLANCGTCGHSCPDRANATKSCAGGVCTYACLAGFASCNGGPSEDDADGCEVNTQTDVNHCGGCGKSCEATKPANTVVGGCTGGVCSYACAVGFADCGGTSDGCETNTQTNAAHCGACGRTCRPGETCQAGSCRCGTGPGCQPGQSCESGACVGCVTGSAPCGGVCVRCVGGTVNAGCACVCPTGKTLCRGECLDPATFATDANNCGSCGHSCNGGTCSGGFCVCNGETCQTGETCFLGECDCCGNGSCDPPPVDGGPYQCGTFGGCLGKCNLGEICSLEFEDGSCECPGKSGPSCAAGLVCHNAQCCAHCPANETFGTGCDCHCGSGPTCGASGSCVGGTCTCGGGDPCGSGQHCSNGVCCPTNFDNCGGICKNTTGDPINCGYCNHSCGPDAATCANDVCTCTSTGNTCKPLEHCVDGACRCGTGSACGPGRHCTLAGTCATRPDPALTSPGRR
jgi:hypothetical protein